MALVMYFHPAAGACVDGLNLLRRERLRQAGVVAQGIARNAVTSATVTSGSTRRARAWRRIADDARPVRVPAERLFQLTYFATAAPLTYGLSDDLTQLVEVALADGLLMTEICGRQHEHDAALRALQIAAAKLRYEAELDAAELAYVDLWDDPDDAWEFETVALSGEAGPLPSFALGVAERRHRRTPAYWRWLTALAQRQS